MVTDEEARDAAIEILATHDFTRWHTDYASWLALLERLFELVPDWLIQLLSILRRGARTLFGWIGDVLGFFGVLGDVSEGIGWLAVCIVVAALIVFGWHWQSRRSSERIDRARKRSPGREHAEALREAAALAREGHYLQAAHRVQLATLALLIEFDWLELARSDPNRTLRDRVRASPLPARERGQLIQLVDRLEVLWFDARRDDRTLFEEWISLDERIVSIATRRAV